MVTSFTPAPTVGEPIGRNLPNVVCPPWCAITTAEHIDWMSGLGGACLHWSAPRALPRIDDDRITEVRLTHFTEPDGSPADDQKPMVDIDQTLYSIEAAEAMGMALLDFVKAARA